MESRCRSGERWIAPVQDFLEKALRGEVDEATKLLAPDVSFQLLGTHFRATGYKGPQQVAQHLAEVLRITGHTLNVLQWEDWMLGVDNIAALVHIRAQRHSAVLTTRVIYLVGMSEDDKIRRVEVFFSDPAAVDQFVKQ